MNAASTEPSARDRSEVLLEHMDALFRFAQAMMPNPTEAAHLVEATYKHAFALLANEPVIADERAWLFGLMRTVRAVHQGRREEDSLATHAAHSAPLKDLRRHLVEQYLDRMLPASLATLSEELRLLVLLCDAEGFTLEEASRVLQVEPIDAHDKLHEARARLQTDLWQNATPLERTLLNTSLSDTWLLDALKRTVDKQFVPTPPTLESTVLDSAVLGLTAGDYQTDREARRNKRQGRRFVSHTIVGVLIISMAGLLGYFGSQTFEYTPDVNVITLSVDQAKSFEPVFRTTSVEQAERWIQDHLQWRLTVPEIQQATLVGAGVSEIAPSVNVPAFVFTDQTTDKAITLYAYSYGLLSRYADRLQLDRDVLMQIEEDSRYYIYDLNASNQVLVWRYRDEIFVAVLEGNAETLRPRIIFPT